MESLRAQTAATANLAVAAFNAFLRVKRCLKTSKNFAFASRGNYLFHVSAYSHRLPPASAYGAVLANKGL